MEQILSYFRDYFDPLRPAPLASHSAGRIAERLYRVMRRRGPVRYVDSADAISGQSAALALSHFWGFESLVRNNRFDRRIAFYSIADPDWMAGQLRDAARDFGVPYPHWDQPPVDFDNAATLAAADRVLLVGNGFTRCTFAACWRAKVRLLNYRVDPPIAEPPLDPARRQGFCFPATHCDLRKGFMDVLRTWSGIDPGEASLEVMGAIRPPWDTLLRRYNRGSIDYLGFLPSAQPAYWRRLHGCRFAFVPTYAEGQMGTLLEAVFSGCLPIATPASGLDERVLAWGLPITARDINGQRGAVAVAAAMSDEEWRFRAGSMLAEARRRHSWQGFEAGVLAAIDELVAPHRVIG